MTVNFSPCLPATVRQCRHALDYHLLPALGTEPLEAIRREQFAAVLYSLYGPPVMANEVVEMLSRLVYMAEGWGSTPEGGNPCKFMHKYNMHSRERFRSGEEFRRLGRVLGEVEACASAAAALRLLMLTGRQRNEILTLRWVDVDLGAGAIQLRDAKTSARSVAPPTAARHMLAVIPRLPDNPWVIAGARPCTDLSNLDSAWLVVRLGGPERVRIHDLRHSFGCRDHALGESLPMVGNRLGHRKDA